MDPTAAKEVLRQELTNDPLGRGYAGLTDQAAADSLNTANRTHRVNVPLKDLKMWAYQNQIWPKVRAGSVLTPTSEAETQAKVVALSVLDFMNDKDFTDIDLDHPASVSMLQGMIACGYVTVEQQAALDAMATVACSRGVELGLGIITSGQVAEARQ